MKINWNYPTSVWVGENRIKDLSQACKNLKISSPLLVTDKDLINLDMVKNVILEIKKNLNNLSIFSNFYRPATNLLFYFLLPKQRWGNSN